jgi:6,7-dimethyl-8-ribityllumazine synthase
MANRRKEEQKQEIRLKKPGKLKIGIVVANWHTNITHAMLSGALTVLSENGLKAENTTIDFVPGSFELVLGAQWQLEQKNDAVICLGCVIKGETMHFDFICHAVANGIKDLNLKFSKPVIFGVLTPNDMKQAEERAGGKHGNKGTDAAVAALQMMSLKNF